MKLTNARLEPLQLVSIEYHQSSDPLWMVIIQFTFGWQARGYGSTEREAMLDAIKNLISILTK